jgi:hypothetical protein
MYDLRILFFEDGDHWVAQCLEYDIGAQAPDLETLHARMRVALVAECGASMELHGEAFAGIEPAPAFFQNLWDSNAGRWTPKEGSSFKKRDGQEVHLDVAICA